MEQHKDLVHESFPKPGMNRGEQNLPIRVPGDTNTLNWGQKGNLAPTDPAMYFQPG